MCYVEVDLQPIVRKRVNGASKGLSTYLVGYQRPLSSARGLS